METEDWITTAVVVGLLGFAAWAIVSYAYATKITLVKDDWICVSSNTTTTYINSNNVLIPIVTSECTNYIRRQ